MKTNIVYLFLVLLCLSCSTPDKLIHYSYNNVTVTRFDKENEIFLYYGEFKKVKSLPENYIKASYHGLDGGMGGYLIFRDDKIVELRRLYDNFEQVGDSQNLLLNDTINHITFGDWSDSIKGNFNNVVRISDVLNLEKRLNASNKSKVNSTYPQ